MKYLLGALLLCAVLIAGLGIVNTLTMSVVERVREIGILRATGLTRAQAWRMVMVESGILGIAGAIIGVVSGLVIGAIMLLTQGGRIAWIADAPWTTIVVVAVIGVAVAMLAAAYPARVASRVSIVRAVRGE